MKKRVPLRNSRNSQKVDPAPADRVSVPTRIQYGSFRFIKPYQATTSHNPKMTISITPSTSATIKPQAQLAYSKSLLLRKVPRRSTDADIRTVFETFGPVRDIYIPKNFDTGRRETYAFIEFVELRDAIKAFSFLQENEMLLEGVILRADFARNGRRSPFDMRGATAPMLPLEEMALAV